MKRIDVLKGLPILAAAVPLLGSSGRTFNALAQATPDPCKHWDFPMTPPGKDGSGGSLLANYRADCGNWNAVGSINMDFLIGKGGQYLKDNIIFTSGTDSCSFHLSQLAAIYGGGSLVNYFKQWFAQMNQDGSQIDVYNGSTHVAHGLTAPKLQTTQIQMYPDTPAGGYQPWTYDWGNTWKGKGGLDVDISGQCAFALGAETIGIIAVIGAAIGGLAGPIEWAFWAAAVCGLIGTMRDVIIDCGK